MDIYIQRTSHLNASSRNCWTDHYISVQQFLKTSTRLIFLELALRCDATIKTGKNVIAEDKSTYRRNFPNCHIRFIAASNI